MTRVGATSPNTTGQSSQTASLSHQLTSPSEDRVPKSMTWVRLESGSEHTSANITKNSFTKFSNYYFFNLLTGLFSFPKATHDNISLSNDYALVLTCTETGLLTGCYKFMWPNRPKPPNDLRLRNSFTTVCNLTRLSVLAYINAVVYTVTYVCSAEHINRQKPDIIVYPLYSNTVFPTITITGFS